LISDTVSGTTERRRALLGDEPPLWACATVAVVIGLVVGVWTWQRLVANPQIRALDFTYAWRAAGHLLAGRNPYENMPAAPYTEAGLFLYPLTTAIVALPFARLSVAVAGTAFGAISAMLFAFALSRRGFWRLIVLLSPAWLLAYYNLQWAPLVMASALLPFLGWIGAAKPNLGLVAFAYRPRWSTLLTGGALIAASLIWVPRWPADWLATLRIQEAPHDPPLLWPCGFVGLLGLLRWRTGEGRVLAAATISPAMSLPYDHLMLWLVAQSWRESLLLVATSWAAWIAALATAPHDLTRTPAFVQGLLVAGMYVPATLIVMRRPNHGAAPAWIDRLTSRWPSWLRGVPA